MQEENAENQNEYKGKKSVPDAEEAVPCWLNCFAGGAVVETGSCVVAHGRQLQAITLLFLAVEKAAPVLPLSSVLLLFFCCVSFSLYSSLSDVSFQDPNPSAPLFLFLTLTIHSPLPLTVPLD
jgi:hypothetical protein